MRQRVAELSAKDQATYSMYEGGKRHECDTLEFLKAKVIPVIERVTQLLAHKDTLNMLLLRAKPKVAAQRVVTKLLGYPRLCDKYREAARACEKKEKEMAKEIQNTKT